MQRIIDIELPPLHHSTSLFPPGKNSYYFILSLALNVKTDDGILKMELVKNCRKAFFSFRKLNNKGCPFA